MYLVVDSGHHKKSGVKGVLRHYVVVFQDHPIIFLVWWLQCQILKSQVQYVLRNYRPAIGQGLAWRPKL